MATRPVIVLFGRDLRLDDNPALRAAQNAGAPIIPLFIFDESDQAAPGAAARWWLHGSLKALAARLAESRLPLILRRGAQAESVAQLVREINAAAVFWNRRYESRNADRALASEVVETGAMAASFNGSLLREPGEVRTGAGGAFRVFTPFWKTLRALGPSAGPLPELASLDAAPHETPDSDDLADWNLLPVNPNWAAEFPSWWTPGEVGAQAALSRFLDGPAKTYGVDRDYPGAEGVSRLSPHIAFGEISPAAVWRAAMSRVASGELPDHHAEKFLAELGWREFSHHLLYHHPEMPHAPLRREFSAFPWADDPAAYAAWTEGRTGFPIVDAGMRQLWRTGWMHNRVRMITASFLVKDLMVPWQKGERWFRHTLVDADRASNAANWQWIAGCGADAAPFFRFFNPVTQGEKFDSAGDYVRRFVPEISALPDRFIHRPWQAPNEILAKAGVKLGKTYPAPIIDHSQARTRALETFRTALKV